jgi:hypothetical protein
MTTLRIDNQYATGRSRQRIERALIDGGKNLGQSPATTRCSTPRAALGAPPAISPTSTAAGSRAVDLTGGVRRNGPLAQPVGRVGGHISVHDRRDPTCRFGQPVSPSCAITTKHQATTECVNKET